MMDRGDNGMRWVWAEVRSEVVGVSVACVVGGQCDGRGVRGQAFEV